MAPNLWALDIDGYTTVKGTSADMVLGFDEFIDSANLTVHAHTKAWQVDILGGGRTMDFDTKLELDFSPPPDVYGDEYWVPGSRADTGGIDRAGSSDLAMDPIRLYGWSFGTGKRIWLGYRTMDIDDDGSWNAILDFNTVMQGMVVGVAFAF